MSPSSSSTDPTLAALSAHPLPGTEEPDDTTYTHSHALAPPVPGSDRYRKNSLAPSFGAQSFVSDSTEQYFTDANEDAQSTITITRSETSASFQDADNTFSSSTHDVNQQMSHSQSTERPASPTLASQIASAAGPATAAAAGTANIPVEVIPTTASLPSGVETSVEPGVNPTKESEYDEKSAGLKTVPSSSQTDETKGGAGAGAGAGGEKGGKGGDTPVDLEDDPELSGLTDEQRRIVVEQM